MKEKDQFAAIAHVRFNGRLKVMLITSRDSKRWVIPKGWPKPGMAPHKLAALEAYEEAGLEGKIAREPLGSFKYQKKMDDGSEVPCKVAVYPLEVTAQHLEWPERMQRDCIWVEARKAAGMVDEKSLRDLILKFADEADQGRVAAG